MTFSYVVVKLSSTKTFLQMEHVNAFVTKKGTNVPKTFKLLKFEAEP